jgi:hypothetical protein
MAQQLAALPTVCDKVSTKEKGFAALVDVWPATWCTVVTAVDLNAACRALDLAA